MLPGFRNRLFERKGALCDGPQETTVVSIQQASQRSESNTACKKPIEGPTICLAWFWLLVFRNAMGLSKYRIVQVEECHCLQNGWLRKCQYVQFDLQKEPMHAAPSIAGANWTLPVRIWKYLLRPRKLRRGVSGVATAGQRRKRHPPPKIKALILTGTKSQKNAAQRMQRRESTVDELL
jgi:hypothetical protein